MKIVKEKWYKRDNEKKIKIKNMWIQVNKTIDTFLPVLCRPETFGQISLIGDKKDIFVLSFSSVFVFSTS